MTIVEEIDKASGRINRSKNVVDALKYWWNLSTTPQNIGEAIKMYAQNSSSENIQPEEPEQQEE